MRPKAIRPWDEGIAVDEKEILKLWPEFERYMEGRYACIPDRYHLLIWWYRFLEGRNVQKTADSRVGRRTGG
uniref:Uncharacterized protein n=1 Tax=viral metagenome TaxID=1070528 RepID=A0A6H1ZPL6_9ZZZZ